MEKLKSVNKNVSLFLKGDILKDEVFKASVQQLDKKIQQMLLLSTIFALWSYLLLVLIIVRIYAGFHGKHSALLVGSLISIYVLTGILIWFTWQTMAYKLNHIHVAGKSRLKFQISKFAGQRRLIFYYLLEYGLLLGISSIFFFKDIHHGVILLLKLTAPVSILTYTLGIYFIVNTTRQIKKLELISNRVDHLFMENINNN